MAKLSMEEINKRLSSLEGWRYIEGDKIGKTFRFKNFREAIAFVLLVAFEAESLDHHPDIKIEYNVVNLILTTHSAGGLTEKDFELARRIDAIR